MCLCLQCRVVVLKCRSVWEVGRSIPTVVDRGRGVITLVALVEPYSML